MAAFEFQDRLGKATAEISRLNAEMEALKARKADALAQGDAANAVKVNHQLKDLQEQLEDASITKAALEAKLRVYKQNEPKAQAIRTRIVEELWPQGIAAVNKIKKLQPEISSVIKEIDRINGTIQNLAAEHEKLVGDGFAVPGIPMPLELERGVTTVLPELPQDLTLKLRSEAIQESRKRAEEAYQAKLVKQKDLLGSYLARANESWPSCESCGAELACTIARVNLEGDPFGFAFEFRCEAASHGDTPRDFINLNHYAIGARLTQLDVRGE